jgi:hypothetical protein
MRARNGRRDGSLDLDVNPVYVRAARIILGDQLISVSRSFLTASSNAVKESGAGALEEEEIVAA